MKNLRQTNRDNPCHRKFDSDRKFVIFDLDGTLIDSFECVFRCVNKTLDSFSLPHVFLPKSITRKDIAIIFKKANEIIDGKVLWTDFKSVFDTIHFDDCIKDVTTIPFSNDLLRENFDKGRAIIIVTNKFVKIAEKICANLFGDVNTTIIGRNTVEPIKSDWFTIAHKIADLGLSLNNCLYYIGDSETDCLLAKKLSVNFLDLRN